MNADTELMGLYRTALNRIQLAFATVTLWSHPDIPGAFCDIYDAMPDKVKLFPGAKSLVHDEAALAIVMDDLYMLAYRSALTDLLEATKTYCHRTGQLEKLKAQPWFEFWRILRNCFSHDMRFNFSPSERDRLPISWSGVTIDLSMNGQPLKHGQMSYAKMKELIETAQSFLFREVA